MSDLVERLRRSEWFGTEDRELISVRAGREAALEITRPTRERGEAERRAIERAALVAEGFNKSIMSMTCGSTTGCS